MTTPFDAATLTTLAGIATEAAQEAAAIVRERFGGELVVEHKHGGGSPAARVVTEVDRRAQAAILQRLAPSCAAHDLAVLAEERNDSGQRLHKPAFWSIDPLDGTWAFVHGEPGFSVSIALVARSGRPLLGVVADPLGGHLFRAITGQGAHYDDEPLAAPPLDATQPLVLQTDPSFARHRWRAATLDGLDDIARRFGLAGAEIRYLAGGVMNACAVLQRPNHCYFKYPRPDAGGGSLWDYAASSCLITEAGGIATDFFGAPLALNRPDSTFMNHRGVLFAGDHRLAAALTALYRRLSGDTTSMPQPPD